MFQSEGEGVIWAHRVQRVVQEGESSFFPPACVPGFAFSLPRMNASLIDSLALVLAPRAVIKSWGVGISPSYYEHGPLLRSLENRRKIEPKEVLSCLIPRLLVVFTLLLTALSDTSQPQHL